MLLKEFDLRRQPGDSIRYISPFREDQQGGVVGKSSDDYGGVDPNMIAATFADLYNRDIARALKGNA